jgi:hypothetical protein
MTPEVERMAREAGAWFVPDQAMAPDEGDLVFTPADLARFASAVRAAALEEAAKACEAIYSAPEPGGCGGYDAYYTRPYLDCAAAIRALKPSP